MMQSRYAIASEKPQGSIIRHILGFDLDGCYVLCIISDSGLQFIHRKNEKKELEDPMKGVSVCISFAWVFLNRLPILMK